MANIHKNIIRPILHKYHQVSLHVKTLPSLKRHTMEDAPLLAKKFKGNNEASSSSTIPTTSNDDMKM
ncbi:hypothetical protein BVRB_2g046850 [Beta vulgaris subsp. vulgaris]|nr:hypothetical protein BVRB_2g046850 [Beta vulgaris subsp. vulgaris]